MQLSRNIHCVVELDLELLSDDLCETMVGNQLANWLTNQDPNKLETTEANPGSLGSGRKTLLKYYYGGGSFWHDDLPAIMNFFDFIVC